MIRQEESLGEPRLVLISSDPFVTTLKARVLACEQNIRPGF